MEFEFRIKEDTRDAEVEFFIEGLETDLKEQQRATSQWKVGIPKPMDPIDRYDRGCICSHETAQSNDTLQ